MEKKRKIPWSTIYLVATIVALVIFGVANQEFGNVFTTLATITAGFIVIAVIMVVVYFFFEGGITHYLLRSLDEKVSFGTSMKIGLIGIYYSYITPSSTGGQPAQVAYLMRDNVTVGSSVAALFIKFFAYQTAFVICTCASAVFMWPGISASKPELIPFILVGIAINSCWIVAIPLLFCEPVLHKLCHFMRWLTGKMKFLKKRDKYIGSIDKFEGDFTNYTNQFKKKKGKVVISVLLSIPQVILQMGVLFFIFRAFGYHEFTFFEITAMQTLLQSSVCFMPMPGAAGAQEIGFSSFFRQYFTKNDLYTAVMVWRFFTYYIVVIAGAVLVVVDGIMVQNKRKKKLRDL